VTVPESEHERPDTGKHGHFAVDLSRAMASARV
jgi:hypothetical protein